MSDPVKPKRRYQSRRRSLQAAETQAAILDAAHRLFTANGWMRTTIAAIATEASISAETIYATFGNKRTILQNLVTGAIRDRTPETPLLEQSRPRAIADETNQRHQVALFAEDIAAVLSRVAPLMAVVRSAAETEPELLELYSALHEGRRKNLHFFVEALQKNGPLRDGMAANDALAIIWRLASPELFNLMRDIEGLPAADFAVWLEKSLANLLLRKKARKPHDRHSRT